MVSSRARHIITCGTVTGVLVAAGLGVPSIADAAPAVTKQTIVSGLSHPWDITWVGSLLIYDLRGGGLYSKRGSAAPKPITLKGAPRVYVNSEGGRLGLVADPAASSNGFFYSCQSTATSSGKPLDVRVLRWQLDSDTTAHLDRTLITGIPVGVGTPNPGRHNGCRLRFGSDGKLFVGTGDAAIGTNSQSLTSLGGKTLRINSNGTIPSDNPYAGRTGNARYVWTYGHRNVQGLALRPGTNQMWSVEHGPSLDDEINRLVKQTNYGWNPVPSGGGSGYNEDVPMTDLTKYPAARPAVWSSGDPTIAPSGGTFLTGDAWGRYQGALAVGVLKDKELMILTLNGRGDRASFERLVSSGEGYGRIRAVQQGPDGALYFTTSNGGGTDRIVKITPKAPRTPPTYRPGLDVTPVGVSIARTGASEFWVFVRSTDNRIYYKRSTDNGATWASWTYAGLTSTSAPSAGSSAAGRIDLVTRDADNTARLTWFTGGRRAGTSNLGGIISAAPVMSSAGDGTMDVFVRGTTNRAHRNHYDGSRWSGWQELGGYFTSALGASVDTTTKQTVVTGRGNDGAGYERTVTPTANGGAWVKVIPRIWSARALGDASGGRTRTGVHVASDSNAVISRGPENQGILATYNSAPDIATRADGTWIMIGRSSQGGVWMYDSRLGQNRNRSLGGTVR